MPEVMIRKDAASDKLIFYIPKKDLEEIIESLEFNTADKWGGLVTLSDGQHFHIDPLDAPPKLPITLRAKRAALET